MNYVDKLSYYFRWAFECRMMRRRLPLSGSIILTDKCNLECKHCIVSNLGYRALTLREVQRDLKTLYRRGARVLVITGGEPFLWRDDIGHKLWDVVAYAKQIGFFRTVVCTNGTIGLNSQADYLWVSIDGVPTDHDTLRKEGSFNTIIKNIMRSKHRRIYVNYTISRVNLLDLEEAVANIFRYNGIRGIFFHLFTPYVGLDDNDLTLTPADRKKAIEKIRALKKKNPMRVLNTFAGLKALYNDNWQRPTWASVVINDGELTECCCRKAIRNPRVCTNCGCTPAVETWVLQEMKPSAIIENLRFL